VFKYWFGSALMQVLRPGKRITEDKSAEWRLQFWNSRFAKWFEKLAKLGLKKSTRPAELTYRPTELAISMAADALFESLPKDQRKELKELPVPDRLKWVPEAVRKEGRAYDVGQMWVNFSKAIRTGKGVEPDFDHAVRRHRMLDAIVRASETGQRQKVVL